MRILKIILIYILLQFKIMIFDFHVERACILLDNAEDYYDWIWYKFSWEKFLFRCTFRHFREDLWDDGEELWYDFVILFFETSKSLIIMAFFFYTSFGFFNTVTTLLVYRIVSVPVREFVRATNFFDSFFVVQYLITVWAKKSLQCYLMDIYGLCIIYRTLYVFIKDYLLLSQHKSSKFYHISIRKKRNFNPIKGFHLVLIKFFIFCIRYLSCVQSQRFKIFLIFYRQKKSKIFYAKIKSIKFFI